MSNFQEKLKEAAKNHPAGWAVEEMDATDILQMKEEVFEAGANYAIKELSSAEADELKCWTYEVGNTIESDTLVTFVKPKYKEHDLQEWRTIETVASLNAKILLLEREIGSLFDKIKHGDEEHQAWLKNAISEHFSTLTKSKGGVNNVG